MGTCRRVKESLAAQIKALECDVHFKNHKWYRSEEARQDIGFTASLESFLTSRHYQDFAKSFREHYCQHECDWRDQCDVLHILD